MSVGRARSAGRSTEVSVSDQMPGDRPTDRQRQNYGGADGSVTEADLYRRVQEASDFQLLRRKFRGFVFPMTALFLGWYLLYVIASAWARDFMSKEVFGNINVALLFGLGQFVSTFLIAWLYARYMSRNVDPLADRVADEMKGLAR
jgi:uncharacterized membrane protein (DUF485 family)